MAITVTNMHSGNAFSDWCTEITMKTFAAYRQETEWNAENCNLEITVALGQGESAIVFEPDSGRLFLYPEHFFKSNQLTTQRLADTLRHTLTHSVFDRLRTRSPLDVPVHRAVPAPLQTMQPTTNEATMNAQRLRSTREQLQSAGALGPRTNYLAR